MLTSPEELRTGNLITAMEGVYRPRGHLGNDDPQVRRAVGLVSRGYNLWERQAGFVSGAPAVRSRHHTEHPAGEPTMSDTSTSKAVVRR